MDFSKQKVLSVIYEGIDEINEQFSEGSRLEKSPQTQLLGNSRRLDSLGFINLIAIIEGKCEERFAVCVSLIQERSDDPQKNPFATLESLADFIVLRLGNAHSS